MEIQSQLACLRNMNRSQESIENQELHLLFKFLHLPLPLQDYEKILGASGGLL